MVLVEAHDDSTAGSTVHLGPRQPFVLVTVTCGRDVLTARLKPSHARLLANSLKEDADACEPWSEAWEDANAPSAPDGDEEG